MVRAVIHSLRTHFVPSQPLPFERAPEGVLTEKPVLMRLMPSERERLQRHAKTLNSSLGAFARRMTLAGLTQFEGEDPAKCVNGVSPNP